eukprot:6704839-Prymnesium_polylepis.1
MANWPFTAAGRVSAAACSNLHRPKLASDTDFCLCGVRRLFAQTGNRSFRTGSPTGADAPPLPPWMQCSPAHGHTQFASPRPAMLAYL